MKIKGEYVQINVKAVITLSDSAKTKMYDCIDGKLWHEVGVPVHEIEDINENKDTLERLDPDLVVMCGWRQIVNKDVLEIPEKGFVGFHPTLLPVGRGSAPIINSIIEGFKDSGLTMFYAAEGLDDGDIIGQEGFQIGEDDYASDVYEKVIDTGRKLIRKYLPLLAEDKAPRIPQDNSKATYFKKRSPDDNKIELRGEDLETAYRKIRALSHPYNGAFIEKEGKKLIIWRAELE